MKRNVATALKTAVLLASASCLSVSPAYPAPPSAPVIIDASSGDAYRADIKSGKSGSALAVFEQKTGGIYRLYANNYSAARGWGGPVIIDAGTGNAYRGKAALDDETGGAIAVFKQETGKGYGIYASIYRQGLWQTPARIDSGAGNAGGAAVVYGPAGSAAAVFEQHDGGAYGIYVNIYDPGKGWLGPARVSRASDSDALFPAHAFDRMGNLHVAYYELDEKGLRLFAASRDAGKGEWGEPVEISSSDDPDAWKAKKSVAHYGMSDAPPLLDEIRRCAYSDAYDHAGWTPSTADARYRDAFTPSMVATTAQGIALFFAQFRDKNLRGFVSYHNPEKGWTPPVLIDNAAGDIEHMRASIGPYGEIALVFAQRSGKRMRVYARAYSPSRGWDNAMPVDEGDKDSYGPAIAFAGNGKMATVWCQQSDIPAMAFGDINAKGIWGKAQRLEKADGKGCGTRVAPGPDVRVIILYEQESALPDGRAANRLYAVQLGE